jgi:DUF1680 family protein
MIVAAMTTLRNLAAVPFTAVNLNDPFWAPRMEVNRAVTIPTQFEIEKQTGRLGALDLKWKKGEPEPHIFWDSDLAKTMEAASYSLLTHPDKKLEKQLDSIIAKMAKAQRKDGYLNSHYIAVEPKNRWTNLRDKHELYCAGHLIEAAVAHFQATGKRNFLDVMIRCADHIALMFGPKRGQKRGYCGHQEIELALIKLYHATGNEKYCKLAQYFIEERGRGGDIGGKNPAPYFDIEAKGRGEDPRKFWAKTYEYMQAHAPIREQDEVVGHAVRAVYFYSGVADLARETGDASLLETLEKLWRHVTRRRMYVTGGLGPSASNEGFTTDYDLPDETAYAETCAGIGLVFWAHRMLHLTGNGEYADVMERALYNNVMAGVSLDGKGYFYENPLASRGKHHRQTWFSCACCPPNVARLLASIGEYVYSTDDEGVWVNLYAQGAAQVRALGLSLDVSTRYPWDGAVTLSMGLPAPKAFALRLRVPAWCEAWSLRINGKKPGPHQVKDGYVHITREWQPGDAVQFNMEMPVMAVRASPLVRQTLGRIALQRGPIVYCLEGVDNGQTELDLIAISDRQAKAMQPVHDAGLLGGVTVLQGSVQSTDTAWGDALYGKSAPAYAPKSITAVPYCTWDNRAAGGMRVWLRAA